MNHVKSTERAIQRELALAYHDLGAATFALVHHGALRDPRLAPRVRRIYELTSVVTEPTFAPPRGASVGLAAPAPTHA